MLTAHAMNPEALKRSYDKKARAYLPKEKLGAIVPFWKTCSNTNIRQAEAPHGGAGSRIRAVRQAQG